MHSRLITLMVLLLTATGVRANVSLPDVISDGMVLQQKQRVPIWGQANPGKDAIEVWSDAVPQPVAVRYAFNNNPRHPNLTNETGLPAAPFRISTRDRWFAPNPSRST